MEKYNYYDAVRECVESYIEDEQKRVKNFSSKDDAYETLYDEMFIADSVTGNASDSYTCNAWRAEEYICHNLELYAEACEEFGSEPKFEGAEAMDVAIRCYLLSEVLSEVLEEMEDNGFWETEEEEEEL